MPPSTLQVSYDGSQLSIIAGNSTLWDILAAVREQTKTEIDVPASASGERMAAVRLGPGPVREVLASLLSSTNFDYIIQASETNPQGVRSVLLVARSESPDEAANGSSVAPAQRGRAAASGSVAESDSGTAETPGPEKPLSQQPATSTETPSPEKPLAQQPATSVEVAPADQQVAPAVPASDSNQPQNRTPDPVIQDFQRRSQQRQQIQQGHQDQKVPAGM